MPELFELDLLWLDGHDRDTAASSVSPFKMIDGPDMKPGDRAYKWTDSPFMTGATLVGDAPMAMAERSFPLRIYPRFSSAHTNLLTNPRPASVVTGWQAEGAGSTVTFNTLDSESVIQAVTTGSANSGMEHSFTGTVAAYSGGVWVKVSSGTAPVNVLFDGETATSGTATTSWQFFKNENKTLTAATRYFQIVQTDTGSRTIYVKMAGVVQSVTYPGYFDGACGDARWNGTAHASTSTAFTGQNAIDRAVGALNEKSDKAIAARGVAGIPLYWTPTDATYGRTTIDCFAVDLSSVKYDRNHRVNTHAECEVKLTCYPYGYGPEYTAGTLYKPAGSPAIEGNITSVLGDGPSPCRLVYTAGSLQDQKFATFGIQGRDYRSGTSLIVRAPSFSVTGFSGTLTAAVNEVQTLSKTGTVSGGTFTITLDGRTTSAIAYNATAATVQAALEALVNIGSGNVACTGGPVNTTNVVITFQGTLAGCNMSLMTEDDSAITGGGTLAIAGTTAGVPGYVSAALYDEWTTICSSGNLSLVGDYRVLARVYDAAATTDIYLSSLRLTWGLGDLAGVTTNNAVVPQAVGDYCLVDLGHVQIPAVATGTQRFVGRIEAKTTGTAGNALRVVDLMFQPMETGIGEVRAINDNSSTLSMFDNFSAIVGAITGDTATSGQTWATMGGVTDADDFSKTSGADSVERTVAASDTTTDIRYGRGVILGSGTPTNVRVSVRTRPSAITVVYMGVVGRFTDNDNFMAAVYTPKHPNFVGFNLVTVYKVVAGTPTVLGSRPGSPQSLYEAAIDLTVRDSGGWSCEINGMSYLSGTDSALATGGALASGKSGIIDWKLDATANTRTYSDFRVSVPTAETIAIYKSQDLQFRSNGDVLREDSAGAGVYSTPAIATVPFLPTLTPAGAEGITNRIFALTSRNNPSLASDPLPDAFDLAVLAKPSYALARWST